MTTAHDQRTYKERRATELADHRYGAALWYAFGAIDTARSTNLECHTKVANADPIRFAELAKDEAYSYYMEEVVSLASVQDQWQAYISQAEG